jgi:hemin uptake protein HemP
MRIIPIDNDMKTGKLERIGRQALSGGVDGDPANAPQPRSPGRHESGGPERVTSRDLLGQRAELIIVHDGREYRLRITQNGKLILTA